MSNPWEQENSKSGLITLAPGHALHLNISGPIRQPSQPLVIIIPGHASGATEWAAVNRLVSHFARVMLYDRSGYGLSTEAPGHVTAVSMAVELNSLLHAINISGPFVLICHSYGGVISREFLNLSTHDVSGIIFVDANQEQHTIQNPSPDYFINTISQGLDFCSVTGLNKNHKLLPAEWQAYLDDQSTEKRGRVAAAEAAGYRESGPVLAAKKQLHTTPPLLGNRPICVLKGQTHRDFENILEAGSNAGNGTDEERKSFREWLRTYDSKDEIWQREMLSLSNRSRWTTASKSGHNIQLTEPGLIIDALRWVLDNI
ncbi:Alpha/Beta hydrolase protein [Talaromyces proteolyticus]|uniref:Alpha/Beta hydrolase protein n=1 Tax=Talaromyces proteolyticus TaxID=1131652 RepID=A0AAD4KZ21_9EURO|nr:Alpha/Beta hydrolase protein [Talaromyces proteolyticus]KAH8699141.1 Alpha/Beta hydrolase protein [Talaromyces proteolyticus]